MRQECKLQMQGKNYEQIETASKGHMHLGITKKSSLSSSERELDSRTFEN